MQYCKAITDIKLQRTIHYPDQIIYQSKNSLCKVLGIGARLKNSSRFDIHFRLYTGGTKSKAVNNVCEEFRIALFWNTASALAGVLQFRVKWSGVLR
jgi:hypothetical protein